jgi:hypothetical protein
MELSLGIRYTLLGIYISRTLAAAVGTNMIDDVKAACLEAQSILGEGVVDTPPLSQTSVDMNW